MSIIIFKDKNKMLKIDLKFFIELFNKSTELCIILANSETVYLMLRRIFLK